MHITYFFSSYTLTQLFIPLSNLYYFYSQAIFTIPSVNFILVCVFTELLQILPIHIPTPPPNATVVSTSQPMKTPVTPGTDVAYCPTM